MKINWMKKNWKKILVFFLLVIFNCCFHAIILLKGSIVYFTFFSMFIFLIFSFSVFGSFHKKFLFFVLFLFFIQILISLINFPACHYNFKMPIYDCVCSGIQKKSLGRSECIGKIKKCYDYTNAIHINKEKFWKLYNEDKHHQQLEISCDNFPNKLLDRTTEKIFSTSKGHSKQ